MSYTYLSLNALQYFKNAPLIKRNSVFVLLWMGFNPKGVGLLVQIVIPLIVLGIIPMYEATLWKNKGTFEGIVQYIFQINLFSVI